MASYIDANMPPGAGGPNTCIGACAEDTAAYLMTFANTGNGGGQVEDFGTYSIEIMDSCSASEPSTGGEALIVFSQGGNKLYNFWSHVGNSAAEFANLKTADYNDGRFSLNTVQPAADGTCDSALTHTGTWVKKIADYDHQHSNGGTFDLNRNVSTLDSIVIELKVNSADTNLPSFDEIKANFGSFASDSEIDALDDQHVVFGVGVTNANDGNGYTGQALVTIDMQKYADKWIRITIPMDQLTFHQYSGWVISGTQNYQESGNLNMAKLFISPETQSGGVLRNYYNGDWSWNASMGNPLPNELFKEQNISLKYFSLNFK